MCRLFVSYGLEGKLWLISYWIIIVNFIMIDLKSGGIYWFTCGVYWIKRYLPCISICMKDLCMIIKWSIGVIFMNVLWLLVQCNTMLSRPNSSSHAGTYSTPPVDNLTSNPEYHVISLREESRKNNNINKERTNKNKHV